ncbi:MAG TPA: proton-conducting transporter membrane subunit, partial [Chloroflexota bacterium]|nr:proton-conducting transporter membrane subunit [Chloroflexota bacterium]
MSVDFTVVLPELIVAITALVVLVADLYLPPSQRVLLAYLSLLGMAIALIDVAVQHATTKAGFNYSVVLDGFSLFCSGVLLVVGIQAVLLSMDYLELEHINFGEYYVLLLGAIGGMMLMAAANSLIVVFVALETFSICLYVLCGFERTREKSLESAIKYFLLSAFASSFLLYGMALTYGATGSTLFPTIANFLRVHGAGGDPILIAGMGLMIVGLAFKMSAVPFHTWVPDVYEGAPSP